MTVKNVWLPGEVTAKDKLFPIVGPSQRDFNVVHKLYCLCKQYDTSINFVVAFRSNPFL